MTARRTKWSLACIVISMKSVIYFLISAITMATPTLALGDQWATFLIPDCFALDDKFYKEHLSIRVFASEAGGGQLSSHDLVSGPLSTWTLSSHPISCFVNGKDIRFETLDYSPPGERGPCGACEQTGFRLTVDGKTIWETQAPKVRGAPIFNGTIDVDREIARVCTQYTPEALGLVLPLPPTVTAEFPPPSVLICKRYRY